MKSVNKFVESKTKVLEDNIEQHFDEKIKSLVKRGNY